MAALAQRHLTVTPTEVMVTASGLLRAANLAVFELGMWQSWTGRFEAFSAEACPRARPKAGA